MSTIDVKAACLWENVATRRWGKYLSDVEWKALQFATGQFDEPGAALEVGAEAGRWSQRLIGQGWRLTCTDICAEKVALCQRNNPTAACHLVAAEQTTLPVQDQSMDLVFAIEVPISSQAWFVKECCRVLRPGGILVTVLLNRASWRGMVDRWKPTEQFYTHSYQAFQRNLLRQRFEVLRTDGFAWLPLPRFSDSRLAGYASTIESLTGLRHVPWLSPWVAVVARCGR